LQAATQTAAGGGAQYDQFHVPLIALAVICVTIPVAFVCCIVPRLSFKRVRAKGFRAIDTRIVDAM